MAEPLKRFLRSLNDAGVEYVVVGGHAVGFHGYPRATQDLDILYCQTADNAQRLAAAVGRHVKVDAPDSFLGPPDEFVVVRFRGEKVDLLPEIDGVGTSEALARAVPGVLFGEPTRFVSRDDLLANKRATGRPKDAVDADMLEEIGP
jgi:Nucleotidyl transferase of unknown function (DUF2204)